jgi:hypothetical protein
MVTAHRLAASSLCALLALLASVLLAPPAHASFGPAPGSFKAATTDESGNEYTQAGGHPFAATTSFSLNTKDDGNSHTVMDGNLKDVSVDLPVGFVGNPQVAPTCSDAALETQTLLQPCPVASQVGVAGIVLRQVDGSQNDVVVPVYNVKPNRTEVAAFTFSLAGQPVHVSARVRPGDYGLRVTISGISEIFPVETTSFTLWGVPADPVHDPQRGQFCAAKGSFCIGGNQPAGIAAKPFLTNPTDCSHGPLTSTLGVASYQDPAALQTATASSPAVTGCDKLSFAPSIRVKPSSTAPNVPVGLSVDVDVPQGENPVAPGTPELKDAVVTLPDGMAVSPSAAGGLEGCSDTQIELGSELDPTCPLASKIGEATITTPLLAEPLRGPVYLGTQTPSQLLRLFLVLRGTGGLLIKIPGKVDPDPVTGQLKATFAGNPQLPFSNLHLELNGGSRAPLVNPPSCGIYTTTSKLTPWSAPFTPDAAPSSSFEITGCSAPRFAPAFSSGTINPQAGGFSPFTLTLSRSDQEQTLATVEVRMPPGLLGVLKSVHRCPAAQAALGTCGAESQIGHTSVAAGPGADPFYLGGNVYLTDSYKGAPFGLSFVVPAIAGPFNLGTVVVRAAINVDPHTAQVSVKSDPLPTILQGIPLDLRTVNVTIDRSGFMFNPTSCNPLSVGGTISSAQGASAAVSSHFQAANCATLPFKPRFTVLTQAKTSKANGASLHVKVTSGAGQANIGKVKVDLPKQLPSRLTTLQKACPDAVFNANPASCPAASLVGEGTAVTPILSSALRGPAYLVSHAGAAFPDLVIVLQGEGITLDLVGNTDIKKGITISTFNTVPDAPISTFDLVLPEGPHSALAAYGNLCNTHLNMPTALTGQNGAQVKQTTRLAVSGCPKAKKHGKAKHGRKHKKK